MSLSDTRTMPALLREPLCTCLARFPDCPACVRCGLRLGCLGSRRHRRVPVKQPAAAVTSQQFAFAQLVPHLGTNPDAATHALLVFGASDAGAARCGDSVKTAEPLRRDLLAERLAIQAERSLLLGQF